MMARELNNTWIRNYFEDYDEFLVDVKRVQTLEVWRELAATTPVDTGRARAGWIATVAKPSKKVPPEAEEGQFLPTTPPRLNRTTLIRDNFVVNNVEYIIPLADGHSQQRQKGWVEKAIAKSIKQVNKQVTSIARRYNL
jgi:hypothetical protein